MCETKRARAADGRTEVADLSVSDWTRRPVTEPVDGSVIGLFAYRRDLVERLRSFDFAAIEPGTRPALLNEAAHELERLEEECFRLSLRAKELRVRHP